MLVSDDKCTEEKGCFYGKMWRVYGLDGCRNIEEVKI